MSFSALSMTDLTMTAAQLEDSGGETPFASCNNNVAEAGAFGPAPVPEVPQHDPFAYLGSMGPDPRAPPSVPAQPVAPRVTEPPPPPRPISMDRGRPATQTTQPMSPPQSQPPPSTAPSGPPCVPVKLAPAPPSLGKHYVIAKSLGMGAFGKVKLAKHTAVDVPVAIKAMNFKKIESMRMTAKVQREIKILALCNQHPHVIRLFEVINTPTDLFLVTEFVSKGELFDHIVDMGKLPKPEARRLFSQLMHGLEFIHGKQICHRDLKPENLLLDEHLNLKIADFGLSNMLRDGEFLRTSCGSPNYAAPELLRGELYAGPEVDTWSSGVILFALLCGCLPFDDDHMPRLMKKIRDGAYSIPHHVEPDARDLITRILVVDPMVRLTVPEVLSHDFFRDEQTNSSVHGHPLAAEETRVVEAVHEQMDAFLCGDDERPVGSPPPDLHRAPSRSELRRACSLPKVSVLDQVAQFLLRAGRESDASAARALVHACVTKDYSGLANPPSAAKATELRVMYQLLDHQRMAQAQAQPHRHGSSDGALAPLAFVKHAALPQRHRHQDPQYHYTRRVGDPRTNWLGAHNRRKWRIGISTRMDAPTVMTRIFNCLQAIGCEWCLLGDANQYSFKLRPRPGLSEDGAAGAEDGPTKKPKLRGTDTPVMKMNLFRDASKSHRQHPRAPVEHLYVLDMQRVEGPVLAFVCLCSQVMTQLQSAR